MTTFRLVAKSIFLNVIAGFLLNVISWRTQQSFKYFIFLIWSNCWENRRENLAYFSQIITFLLDVLSQFEQRDDAIELTLPSVIREMASFKTMRLSWRLCSSSIQKLTSGSSSSMLQTVLSKVILTSSSREVGSDETFRKANAAFKFASSASSTGLTSFPVTLISSSPCS